ncbi:MAG: ABC transporter ATP-binding protein [Desulfovibrionaceae bacterium]|nr:ABC transporter ATP-binding protein [Desulfovibrionaceae bacterium]
MSALYTFDNVVKTYEEAGQTLEILRGVSISIEEGEQVAIVGASGSGKSTLLHLMGALDTPTSGKVLFRDRDIFSLTPDEQASFRNRTCGYVFQFHHLLSEFSAEENVAMPAIIAGRTKASVIGEAREMLDRVGLADKHASKVNNLSGGERQRVAIARAVLMHPEVLLADEPTGNLDEKTGAQVVALLKELNHELGMTTVVVTHNAELAAGLDRSLELRTGLLYDKTIA